MNLTKCSNGHFYDGDTYASCPHCGGGGTENVTIPFSGGSSVQDIGATMPLTPPVTPEPPLTPDFENVDFGLDDDAKTISIYQNNKVETPVMAPTVGWLVCTKGKFYGQDFKAQRRVCVSVVGVVYNESVNADVFNCTRGFGSERNRVCAVESAHLIRGDCARIGYGRVRTVNINPICSVCGILPNERG